MKNFSRVALVYLSAVSFISLSASRGIACENEAHADGAAVSGKPSLTLVSEGSEKAVFQVKGMSCRGCEKKISASLQKLEGVKGVTFGKKGAQGARQAEVVFASTSKVTKAQLIQAVQDAGYQASTLE